MHCTLSIFSILTLPYISTVITNKVPVDCCLHVYISTFFIPKWAFLCPNGLFMPKWHSLRSLPFLGAKKSGFSGPTPSNDPRNEFAPINITKSNKRHMKNKYKLVILCNGWREKGVKMVENKRRWRRCSTESTYTTQESRHSLENRKNKCDIKGTQE